VRNGVISANIGADILLDSIMLAHFGSLILKGQTLGKILGKSKNFEGNLSCFGQQ
jgi:hypothetical protein